MEPQRPRVLVIRGGAIGDFILTLPAIRLLRESIAGCHLEALGYPGIVELAKHAGLADATRSLEHRTMASLFAPGASIDPALVEYLCSFNLVVSYLFDPDGILRANLERIGVKTLIECPHRVVDGQGHASEQLARPLQKLAMFLEEPGWRAPLFISTPLASARRITIHLGSGSETKNWPAEHWQRLADELQTRHPQTSIVFITGVGPEQVQPAIIGTHCHLPSWQIVSALASSSSVTTAASHILPRLVVCHASFFLVPPTQLPGLRHNQRCRFCALRRVI
jgi:heptosyltransferase III